MEARSRQESGTVKVDAREWISRVVDQHSRQWKVEESQARRDLEDWQADEVWTSISGYLAQMYLPGEG